jgi:cytochrome c peroxidase
MQGEGRLQVLRGLGRDRNQAAGRAAGPGSAHARWRWAAAAVALAAVAVLAVLAYLALHVRTPVAAPGAAPEAVTPGSLPGASEPIEPLPRSVPGDPARIALGERLFADARLSHDRQRACTTCHPLARAGVDGRARAEPADGRALLRNTPTVFNLAFDLFYNWDGSTDNLPEHDNRVLLSPAIMATTWEELLPRLRADAGYVAGFSGAYAGGITASNVLDALAAYERSLVTPDSRFDRFLRGEHGALTAEELHGYQMFKSLGCIACHQGRNVGGNLVQRFGVFADTSLERRAGDPLDLGRYNTTHDELDRQVFRVPSLRNVATTAPYFHDGRADTLSQAVATMARVQLGRDVSGADIQAIVAFLGTLTGRYQGRELQAAP